MTEPPRQLPLALQVRDLGRVAYCRAERIQRRINEKLIAGTARPTLLLLEHDPVITLTPRPAARSHLLASQDQLATLGIDVQPTDRGGDITYHGPGQLVAYPILRLNPLGLNLSRYMRLLEQIVIDTLARLDIHAQRQPGATGVWVQPAEHHPPAKICALGVRIRKNTTLHGLALNVHPNLAHFSTIIPCGLHEATVTSLHQLLHPNAPDMPTVKRELTHVFHEHLHRLGEPGDA